MRRERKQHIWAERFELRGRQMYWQVVASPLRGDERLDGVALVIDDLTKRKEQEEQRRLLGTFVPEELLQNISSISQLDTRPAERVITALFADIRGFTKFSETMQPEDLMRIVNRYLGAASDAIAAHDGIIEHYVGDAITALWNSQLNQQEDHAIKAVRAALAIREAARGLHQSLPAEQHLQFGIGLHSGHAVLGMVGGANRIEFSALGDAPAGSRYLQEIAEPGEIFISGATYEEARDRIAATPQPLNNPPPGFAHLSTVYRLN